MSFFRSAAARRIFYAILIGLAVVRFATRARSEPIFEYRPTTAAAIVQLIC